MPGSSQKISVSPALAPKPHLERNDSSTPTPVPELSQRSAKDLPPEQEDGQVGVGTLPEVKTGRPGFNAGMLRLEKIVADLAKQLELNGKAKTGQEN